MTSASEAVEAAYKRIAADGRDGIWIALADREVALAAAAAVDDRLARGEHLPLAGRTLAVKDNIDVAGLLTTAGCPSYAFEPTDSAPAVAALVAAGAVVVGKTNLDQFATGLVGTRSPHGACPNAHWDGLISGGSSAGSAVAVAAGLVDIALGTDTAGSGRVPAAANGIVGVKPTRGRISTEGVVPACRTFDCVSTFAASAADAALVAVLAAGEPVPANHDLTGSLHRRSLRVGIPAFDGLTFDGDILGPARFSESLGALVATGTGWTTSEVDLLAFRSVGDLLYGGAFVAERYEAVGEFVASRPQGLDPIVASIILAAADVPAWKLARDQARLADLAAALAPVWDEIDVLVVPSVPRIPTIAEVAADPIGVNAMLGTYTNFVNLLDLAAVTFPVIAPPGAAATTGEPAAPPPSLTVIGPAGSDALLAAVAGAVA
ncbi:MAG: allophanate hydrolase [Acidimicrobiales bacterium]|nr:allophanate hydrolase [Acidimicrobiales bacterium]